MLSFFCQNRIHFNTRKKRVFPRFFSQLPENRVFKLCRELETSGVAKGEGPPLAVLLWGAALWAILYAIKLQRLY